MKKKASNCTSQEKFQHFSNNVFYIFYEIFNFLLYLHMKTINLPTKNNTWYFQTANNPKYFLYFWNYLGILNNTYILAYVSIINGIIYENQNSILLTNIFWAYIIDT